jgi:hypothetical protein
VRVPHVEILHGGEFRHGGPVALDGVAHRPILVLRAKGVVARGDQHARGQALDIPLPRTWQRLIEIIDVGDQPPLGRGEHAEVRQVRVAAALDGQSGPW